MANIDVKVSAKISLATIFKKLHEKALGEAEKNGFELANSAIVDNKFQGPGEFFISVKKQDGSEFTADEALPSLQTYVQWFNGPDTAKKITAQSLIPVENNQEDTSEEKEDNQEKEDTNASDEEKSDDEKSDNKETSDNNAEDQPSEQPEEKPTGESISYLDSSFRFLLETNDDKEDKDDKNIKRPAWGISYKIKEIKGKPFKKLEDSLKDLMKSKLSIKLGWTTLVGSGGNHELGTIELSPEKFFKEVDTDELLKAVIKQADEDFKGNKIRISVDSKDNTLKQLKGIVDKKTKAAIQSTKECMMFKIPKNDKHFKEYNQTSLAKCITKGWESLAKGIGLFKKGGSSLVNMFKSLVKPNEIIRITQPSNDNSGSQTTEESLLARFYPNLLTETGNTQSKSISDINIKVHNDFSSIKSFKKIAGVSELPNEKILKISTKIYTDIFEFSSDYGKQFDISKINFDPNKNEALVSIKLINISTQSDDIKKYEEVTKSLNDTLPKDLYQKYKLVADGPVNQIFSNQIKSSEKSQTSESSVIDDRYKGLFSLLFENNNLIDDYILTESLIEDDLSEYLTGKKHPISTNKKQYARDLIARRSKQLEAAKRKDKESEDSVENNTEDISKDASETSENQTSDNEESENKEQTSDNDNKDNQDSSSNSEEDNDNKEEEKSNTGDSENDEDVKDNSEDKTEDSEETNNSEEDNKSDNNSEEDKKQSDDSENKSDSKDDNDKSSEDSDETNKEDSAKSNNNEEKSENSEDNGNSDEEKSSDSNQSDDKQTKDSNNTNDEENSSSSDGEESSIQQASSDGSNDSNKPSVAYILKVSTEELGTQKLFSDYDVLYLYPIKN